MVRIFEYSLCKSPHLYLHFFREFLLPTVDLPIGEPDHPEMLLADIDTRFLELSSMHCKGFFVGQSIHH